MTDLQKNYWASLSEPASARWLATFRPAETRQDVERLVSVGRALLDAGSFEDIYTVLETRAPHRFRAAPGWTYGDFMDRTFAQTGTLPFFDTSIGVATVAGEAQRTPARICYWNDQGGIVHEYVDDMGNLLERLRPQDADWGARFMEHVAPITIIGRRIDLNDSDARTRLRPIELSIELDTDIWLPFVIGWLDDSPRHSGRDWVWHDNRPLSQRHTPAFNRFLAKIRDVVVAHGGTWGLAEPEGSAVHYAPMVSERGIVLDYELPPQGRPLCGSSVGVEAGDSE